MDLQYSKNNSDSHRVKRWGDYIYLLVVINSLVYVGIINLPGNGFYLTILLYSIAMIFIALLKPRIFLLALIALLPLESRMMSLIRFGEIDITFARLMLFAVGIVFIRSSDWRGYRTKSSRVVFMMLSLWIAVDILATIAGDGMVIPSVRQTFVLLFEVILLPLVCRRIFKSEELSSILIAFGVGASVLCICVVIERFTSVNFLLRFPTTVADYAELQGLMIIRDNVIRVKGPFTNPVYLGGFAPVILFAGFYLAAIRRHVFWGFSVLLAGVTLALLTVSRTAIYGSLIFFILGSAVVLRSMIARLKRSQAAIGIVFIGIVLSIAFWDDASRALRVAIAPTAEIYEGANTTSRAELFVKGIPIIMAGNPFGLGFDDAAILRMQEISPDIANFYIGFTLVRGWIWMLAFLGLMIALLFRLIRIKDQTSLLLAALLLSLLATYFAFAEYWISLQLFLIWYFVHDHRIQGRKSMPHRVRRVFIPIGTSKSAC